MVSKLVESQTLRSVLSLGSFLERGSLKHNVSHGTKFQNAKFLFFKKLVLENTGEEEIELSQLERLSNLT